MSAAHTPGRYTLCVACDGRIFADCDALWCDHCREAWQSQHRAVRQEPEANAAIAALRACADYLDCIPESAAGGDDDALRLVRIARAAIAAAAEGQR